MELQAVWIWVLGTKLPSLAQSHNLPASAFLVLGLQGSISIFVTEKKALISIYAHLMLKLALLHWKEVCSLHLCAC